MQALKQAVVAAYSTLLQEKIHGLESLLQDVIDSTRNETKSSAGDKYETGRAMLQIEQDNIRKQLREAYAQQAAFNELQPEKSFTIVKGSLVKTNLGYFLVSTALPKIIVAATTVMSISPHSPLGRTLMGKKINDTVSVNGRVFSIEEIV